MDLVCTSSMPSTSVKRVAETVSPKLTTVGTAVPTTSSTGQTEASRIRALTSALLPCLNWPTTITRIVGVADPFDQCGEPVDEVLTAGGLCLCRGVAQQRDHLRRPGRDSGSPVHRSPLTHLRPPMLSHRSERSQAPDTTFVPGPTGGQ